MREMLRQQIHRLKPWEHSRKKYTPEWAAHLQAICKKVDGYYASGAEEDRRRLREEVQKCQRLLKNIGVKY
jgi:mevalonate kinase